MQSGSGQARHGATLTREREARERSKREREAQEEKEREISKGRGARSTHPPCSAIKIHLPRSVGSSPTATATAR